MEATLDALLSALARSAPLLEVQLARTRADWEPDEPPPTVVMGDVGQCLAESALKLTDDELRAVVELIEHALEHAADTVKDAVATGLLEAAMSVADTSPSATRFLAALGPRAKAYGREWDRFTNRKTPGISE
jgi:hypothetical protein